MYDRLFLYFVIVYSNDPITLMNLKPSTKYHVRVQLSRPGDGGKGSLGPEAIMETDCPGKSQSTRKAKSECYYISYYKLYKFIILLL